MNESTLNRAHFLMGLNYYGMNHIYLANNVYLCRKKEGVYEYQRISFDIYGRANGCHAS